MSNENKDDQFLNIMNRDICYGLFVAESGTAISFGLKISDEEIKESIVFIIEESGGRVEQDLNLLKPYTVILTDKDFYRDGIFDRIAFNYKYVYDCVSKMELLPLGKYSFSPHVQDEDFFEVIYFLTKDFKNLDITYVDDGIYTVESQNKDAPPILLSLPEEKERFKNPGMTTRQKSCINYLEDDDDGFIPGKVAAHVQREGRKPYTRHEKEAILKYLVRKGHLTGLRGNPVWKKIEKAQVCPNRTWQSLKNHFLKSLVPELDRYPFLTFSEKELMRGESD